MNIQDLILTGKLKVTCSKCKTKFKDKDGVCPKCKTPWQIDDIIKVNKEVQRAKNTNVDITKKVIGKEPTEI